MSSFHFAEGLFFGNFYFWMIKIMENLVIKIMENLFFFSFFLKATNDGNFSFCSVLLPVYIIRYRHKNPSGLLIYVQWKQSARYNIKTMNACPININKIYVVLLWCQSNILTEYFSLWYSGVFFRWELYVCKDIQHVTVRFTLIHGWWVLQM